MSFQRWLGVAVVAQLLGAAAALAAVDGRPAKLTAHNLGPAATVSADVPLPPPEPRPTTGTEPHHARVGDLTPAPSVAEQPPSSAPATVAPTARAGAVQPVSSILSGLLAPLPDVSLSIPPAHVRLP